jgi:hypothetical protein
MSSPLPYCRTNQTSSDVGMIGMITASARRSCTYGDAIEPSRNSSMISRARGHAGTRAHAQGKARHHQRLTDTVLERRRIAHPKARDYADFQSTITSGICDRRNTNLRCKNPEQSLSALSLGSFLIPSARWLCRRTLP